jgi:hypothetical protein
MACAPVWRLVWAFVLGQRDQAHADLRRARVAPGTDHHSPFCTRAHWPEDPKALLPTEGEGDQPARPGTRGAYPTPRRRPLPALVDAQVVKHRAQGRVVEVDTHVVCGPPEAGAAYLATSPVSHTVHTSVVARANLTQRQSHRRLTRRTTGFSQDLTWLEQPWWVSLASSHLVLPHKR